MKYYITTVLLACLLLSCNATQHSSSSWKKITGVTHTTVNNIPGIYAIDSTGKTILLEEDKGNSPLDFNNTGIQVAANSMSAPPSHQLLIDYTIKDNMLLLLHAQSGVLNLRCYKMTEDGKAKPGKIYFIDHHHIISQANGGDYSYRANLSWIGNDLYMQISGGQLSGEHINGMYKYAFDANDSSVANPQQEGLPEVSPLVSRIDFSQPGKYVKVFVPSQWYKKNYERQIKTSGKKTAKTTFKYMDKPYYYKIMDNSANIRSKEEMNMKNGGLENYPLFTQQNYTGEEPLNLKKAESYIKELFKETGIDDTSVKIQNYIPSPTEIYFFYQTSDKKINIIIYDKDHSMWKKIDIKESPTAPRQLRNNANAQ